MKYKKIFFALWVGVVLIAGCGPTEEEVATMTASAWTQTPIPPTVTPSPTPMPYDLTVSVTDAEGNPVTDARVVFPESGNVEPASVDGSGSVSWTNLDGPAGSVTVTAQGYFKAEQSLELQRGLNEVSIQLERDPFGVVSSAACGEGESLLYVDDFQDGEAQGWNFSYNTNAGAHYVGPAPDAEANSVLFIDANKINYYGGDAYLGGSMSGVFGDAVWRMKFMVSRVTAPSFTWQGSGPLEYGGNQFTHAQYGFYFPGGRSQAQLNRSLEGGPNAVVSNPRLTTASFRQAEMQWYQVEISTYQGHIQLWIDGKKLMEYTDTAPLPPGDMGIWIGAFTEPSTTVLYFDDIRVCELSAPFATVVAETPAP